MKKKNAVTTTTIMDLAQDVGPKTGKTLAQLDAKAIKLGLKNKKTREDFLTEYNCTDEQFSDKLHQIYVFERNLNEVLKDLEKNETLARRSSSTTSKIPAKKTAETTQERIQRLISQEIPKEIKKLEAARAEIQTLDDSIVAEEKTCEELKKGYDKKRQACTREILDIKRTLEKKEEEKAEIDALYEKTSTSMNQLHEIHTAAKARLKDLDEAIAKALMPIIWVYKDGSINVEQAGMKVDFSFDNKEVDALAASFISDERFGSLIVTDLKTVAKARVAAKHFGNAEFVCDDSKIEDACHYASENF